MTSGSDDPFDRDKSGTAGPSIPPPDDVNSTRRIGPPESVSGTLARRPYLVVLAGPRVGEVIAVAAPMLIGREPRSGLHLLDEGVSRRHCTVAPEGQRIRLTDLDSTNGTWISGKRIRTHLLSDGE